MRERPKDDDPALRAMTDTDIVTGLRSLDGAKRAKALEALCGINGGVLIISGVKNQLIAATPNLNAGWTFPTVLFLAQQLGRAMGLHLNWVPDPAQIAAQQQGIVIAQPDHLPKPPGG